MNAVELKTHPIECAIERGPAILGLGWVIWFFAMLAVGSTGLLKVDPDGIPFGILTVLLAPIALFVIDITVFNRKLFAPLWSAPLAVLTRLQVYRVAGAIFLVEWALGRLPWQFAFPAALGDIAIGIAALFIADGLAGCGQKDCRNPAVWWNILGLADFLLAVSLGVLYSPSALGIFAGTVTTESLSSYPLSLIPTFLVPFSIILHVTGWIRLKTQ